MKKMLIFACLLTTLIHAMENDNPISLVTIKKNFLTLKCNKTYIHLTKGPLSEVTERENQTMIVGANQQGWSSSGKFTTHTTECFPDEQVGKIKQQHFYDNYYINQYNHFIYPDTHYLYENDDSASDDDTYKPYTRAPLNSLCKDAHKLPSKTSCNMRRTTTSNHVVMIAEPCIKQAVLKINKKNNKLSYIYDSCRYNTSGIYNSDDWDDSIKKTFTGDKAIEEASKDLYLCYQNILSYEPKRPSRMNDSPCFQYSHKDEKTGPTKTNTINIVIPALSTGVGFPRDIAAPIAVAAILENLKKHPDTFDNITLVITKRSDFTLYKKLLTQHAEPIEYYKMFEF